MRAGSKASGGVKVGPVYPYYMLAFYHRSTEIKLSLSQCQSLTCVTDPSFIMQLSDVAPPLR